MGCSSAHLEATAGMMLCGHHGNGLLLPGPLWGEEVPRAGWQGARQGPNSNPGCPEAWGSGEGFSVSGKGCSEALRPPTTQARTGLWRHASLGIAGTPVFLHFLGSSLAQPPSSPSSSPFFPLHAHSRREWGIPTAQGEKVTWTGTWYPPPPAPFLTPCPPPPQRFVPRLGHAQPHKNTTLLSSFPALSPGLDWCTVPGRPDRYHMDG